MLLFGNEKIGTGAGTNKKIDNEYLTTNSLEF